MPESQGSTGIQSCRQSHYNHELVFCTVGNDWTLICTRTEPRARHSWTKRHRCVDITASHPLGYCVSATLRVLAHGNCHIGDQYTAPKPFVGSP